MECEWRSKRASPPNSTVPGWWYSSFFFCCCWCSCCFVVIHFYEKLFCILLVGKHIYACTMYKCWGYSFDFSWHWFVVAFVRENVHNLIFIFSLSPTREKKNDIIVALFAMLSFSFSTLFLFILTLWPYLSALFGVLKIEMMLIFTPANFWSDELIRVFACNLSLLWM